MNKVERRVKYFIGFTGFGAVIAMTASMVAHGAVPAQVPTQVIDDTALYENLSEIDVRKEAEIDFDEDLRKLERVEYAFYEDLASKSIQSKRKRVQARKEARKRAQRARSLKRQRLKLERKKRIQRQRQKQAAQKQERVSRPMKRVIRSEYTPLKGS